MLADSIGWICSTQLGEVDWNILELRTLAKSMMDRVDVEGTKHSGDLVPGGDIRIQGNQWLRAAFSDSNLKKVPREMQVRHALTILVKKKHMRTFLSRFVSVHGSSVMFRTCLIIKTMAKALEGMLNNSTSGSWSRL